MFINCYFGNTYNTSASYDGLTSCTAVKNMPADFKSSTAPILWIVFTLLCIHWSLLLLHYRKTFLTKEQLHIQLRWWARLDRLLQCSSSVHAAMLWPELSSMLASASISSDWNWGDADEIYPVSLLPWTIGQASGCRPRLHLMMNDKKQERRGRDGVNRLTERSTERQRRQYFSHT